MSVDIESILPPPPGESFRLLRWRNNLKEVDYCEAFEKAVPVRGAGDHWHLHSEMELTWIEQGSGTRIVGDHIERFKGPELVLLGAHLPHCWHGLRQSSGLAVQFCWPLGHPIRNLPEFGTFQNLWDSSGHGLLFPLPVGQKIGVLLARMISESPPVRLGLLFEILGELAGVPDTQICRLSEQNFSLGKGTRHQAGLQRVIQYALSNYSSPFEMEETLRLAGMSKPTFSRQFLKFTGLTYTDFLLRIRLDHARQQILTTDEAVSSIAFDVGFNHLSHFNRAYRERFQVTPSEDRARLTLLK